ncbi:MAG: lipopolysaccharide biosynthesis protein [Candidatus Limiplasma sp.]|nr:lipopolysaccharide biosynthesis protein [Candidatus Limiplasma sp.]
MSETTKRTAGRSFLFKLAESTGTQGISFLVGIVLARLLDPTDYAVLTLLTVFISLSRVFVQSGLNTALVQRLQVDETDLSSVFYLSLGIAAGCYALLYVTAPLIAAFYRQPELTALMRVLALVLLPGALNSVQQAVIARQMSFHTLMWASIAANVLSGAAGIAMAAAGAGAWALIVQQLVNQVAVCIILLFTVPWRPRLLFSWNKVRGLFSFGWKLLVSSLIETLYNNLRTLVIGRVFDKPQLGYYNRGRQFPELVMNNVNGSIQSVMLPVLSGEQERRDRMKAMTRRAIMASSYLVFPMMAGLALVADPLIRLLLTDKWLPCVPFLWICCADFAFYPVHTSNLQAINAMGRSDVFLRLEVIKKAYGLAILAISLFCFHDVLVVAGGSVVSTLIATFVNAAPNKRLLNYRYLEQVRDLLPSLGLTALMGAAVWAAGLIPLAPLWRLLVQTAVGVAVYGGLSVLCKPEAYRGVLDMARALRSRPAPDADPAA